MYRRIDASDPEMIREIARKHWEAINTALTSGGDVDRAFQPQKDFLEKYIPSLPPELAKLVAAAYSAESTKHAAEAKRISEHQLDKARHRAVVSSRIKRNTIVFSAVMVLLLVAKVISMTFAA